MTDVFVSYKAEDRRRVKPLVEALQADGFSVWWDEQIGGGAQWRQSIETELNAAKCVIVVWSTRSIGPDGTFVQDEATRAQQRHVYVPVLIDKVHLPLGFGETQALPLVGWHGNGADPKYQAVLAAVRRNVGGKRRSGSPLPARPTVDRRTVIAGGTIAAVAVAGAGGWALLRSSPASASDSIAVLPFANLSGDPGQTYFSDGLAEELRTALARLSGIQVVGRTSSEAVRNDDAQTAAKRLGVDSILTGSVRRSDTMIRVSAQLVNGRTGLERWSQDYDRSPGDALKIQTDIAENVAHALALTLGRGAVQAITAGGTSNAAAHDLYLKASEQLRSEDSEESFRQVIGLFDGAIALDPKYAEAYAQKSFALALLTGFFATGGTGFDRGYREAAAVAQQAIALAPGIAAGHASLGYVLENQLNMTAAYAEFKKAYALAPGEIDILIGYGVLLAKLGNPRTAMTLVQQAERRDPLNPSVYSSEGQLFFNTGQYAQAANAFQKALAIAPKRVVDRSMVALCLGKTGRINEALAEFNKVPPDGLFRLAGESIMLWKQGNRSASEAALQRAQQVIGEAANYQYAEIYAQRGDTEQAIAHLDRAWALHDPGLTDLKVDPLLDPIRSDPRFAALLQKLNFPSVGAA